MSATSTQTTEPIQEQLPTQLPAAVRRLVLTGFMGAGKSTVGRLVAQRLGWTFVDLDALLEQRAGTSIPQLFGLHGEPHFRRLESSALAAALRQPNTVLALGGGAPETLTNRLLLEQTPGTYTIFLDAPFPVLYDRCVLQALNTSEGAATRDTDRPNLRDPEAAQTRFITRHPLYRRLAHLTVDTAGHSPAETAASILESFKTSR